MNLIANGRLFDGASFGPRDASLDQADKKNTDKKDNDIKGIRLHTNYIAKKILSCCCCGRSKRIKFDDKTSVVINVNSANTWIDNFEKNQLNSTSIDDYDQNGELEDKIIRIARWLIDNEQNKKKADTEACDNSGNTEPLKPIEEPKPNEEPKPEPKKISKEENAGNKRAKRQKVKSDNLPPEVASFEPRKIQIGNLTVEIQTGDLFQVKADLIVNAANKKFAVGNGLCGEFNKRAGSGVFDESQAVKEKLLENEPTLSIRAIMSSAGKLAGKRMGNKGIIHAVAPKYKKKKISLKDVLVELKEVYKQTFRLASGMGDAQKFCSENVKDQTFTSIALGSLGTGLFRIPVKEASQTFFEAVEEFAEEMAGAGKKLTIKLVLLPPDDPRDTVKVKGQSKNIVLHTAQYFLAGADKFIAKSPKTA